MDKTYVKIYLDEGFASEHGGGIGVYSELLLSGLTQTEFDVTPARYPRLQRIRIAALRRILYSLYINLLLPGYLKKRSFAIAHFTNFQLPARKNGFTKYISTVHDLNPILYPDTVPPLYLKYYDRVMRNIVRNADCIITVSKSVKDAISKRYSFPERNIKVCSNALRADFLTGHVDSKILNDFALDFKNYFLFVGRLERKKNLVLLVKAFSEFKRETGSSGKLVLVGVRGFGFDEIAVARSESGCENDIILTGYVSLTELKTLYAAAGAFILPSLDEGFCIPLVEAMGFGLPLILSDIATSREIVGSKAIYFDTECGESLKRVLVDFAQKSLQPVDYSEILSKYSVEKMIDSHLKVYAEVV